MNGRMDERMNEQMDALPDPTAATNAAQQAIEDLFDEVRALEPAAREAAIEAAAVSEVVRREVRSLLRYARPGDDRAVAPRASTPLDAAELKGVRADGFVLGEPIGTGGMGVVFDAMQEMPARRVAVKVLAADFARPADLARFRRESEFLARLAHPGIARVIAAGTLAAPGGARHPYIAMELVDGGRAITRWAEDERPGRDAIVRRFIEACDAVGFGHRRGVVHLDVKPSNILVSRDGEVRVIDYGVARSLEGDEPAEGRRGFAGTPQYMAPERFDAAAAVADSRADVYALGLVLFELLAGRPPYSTKGCSAAEAARVVASAEIPRLRRVDSTVPAPLEAIVAKAIARDRDARYGTASELADDLRRFLADEAVVAAPDSAVHAIGRLVRRHRIPAAFALIAAIAIVAGAGVAIAAAIEAREAARREERIAERANIRAAAAAARSGDPAAAAVLLGKLSVDARGWESRHLTASLSRFELLSRIDSELLRVVVIPKTGEIVCGVTGGFVTVTDPARPDEYELHDLRAQFGEVTSPYFPAIAASEDGATIFATLGIGRLVAIDRASGAQRAIADGETVWWCAQVDGALVIRRPDGFVLADIASGKALSELVPITDILDLFVRADGRAMLASIRDGSIAMFDLDARARSIALRWRTPPRADSSRAVVATPDGTAAIVAWRDGSISRHDCADGTLLVEAELPGGSVFDLAISPDGGTLAASSWTGVIRVIDARSLAVIDRVGGTRSHVWDIAFSADGSRVYGRCDVEAPEATPERRNGEWLAAYRLGPSDAERDRVVASSMRVAVCEPGTGRFVAATTAGSIVEIDARTGESREVAKVEPAVRALAPNGRSIAVGFVDGSVALLEPAGDGALVERWRTPVFAGNATALAWSPDRARIACGGGSIAGGMLDAATGALAWRVDLPIGKATPDRRRVCWPQFLENGSSVTYFGIAAAAEQPVFRTRDGTQLRLHCPEAGEAEWYASVPGSDLVVGAGVTGTLLLHRPGLALDYRDGARNGGTIAVSPDGGRIAFAARDGLVRIFDTESFEELIALDLPPGYPLAAGFDAETDEVSVLTSRGILRTWGGRTPAAAVPGGERTKLPKP